MKQITEQIESVESSIAKTEAEGISYLYGDELGTAKLVRADKTVRIFSKEVEKAKSGKAVLVELHAFIQKSGEEWASVRGHTYLPNFVVENKDVYWILKNKISGISTDNPDNGNIKVDRQYVPQKYKTWGNYWSNKNNRSPEQHFEGFIDSLKGLKEGFEKDLKLEVGIPAFMEMVA